MVFPPGVSFDPRRDDKMLCVVEEVADLWALDRSRLFPGRYHVLGGRLSALAAEDSQAAGETLLRSGSTLRGAGLRSAPPASRTTTPVTWRACTS